MGGGPSVPSNTTQTQMLDPTRQAGLQKALDYAYKWADNYKGQSYPGQRVAGLTSDWYAARDTARRMGSRLASSGGIMSVRRFDDGGTTDATAGATAAEPTYGNANFSAQQVTDFINENKGNPQAIFDAAKQYGISDAQIAEAGKSAANPNDFSAANIAAYRAAYEPAPARTPTVTSSGSPFTQAQNQMQTGTGMAYGMVGATPGQVAYNYTPSTYTAPKITYNPVTGEAVNVNQISDAEIAKAIVANPDMWNESFMQKYMSPYTQGVVNIAKREADRQYQQQLQQEKSQATAAGAFGGYRQGVVEAEGARNQAQLLNDIQTKGMQDAYNAATAQFNADRQALMQTGQFNAQQASQIAAQNLNARMAAEQQRSQQAQAAALANQTAGLTAQQAEAQYGLQGFQANEEAKRALASGSLQAGSTNVQNALSARTQDLNAIQQGMQGAQGLGALEAQYQNTLLNQANLQNQIAGQDQAYQQAIINDAMAAWDKLQGTDAEKAKMLSSIIGMLPGGTTSVKVSS